MDKTNVKKMKVMTKAYEAWRTIENDVDLRKNKLTLNEYQVLTDVLKKLSTMESDGEYTLLAGVANWCKKHGLFVKPDGINYKIGLVEPN